MSEDPFSDHEYLPITGYPPYLHDAQKMLFGSTPNIVAIQTAGGTGALHLGATFLSRLKSTTVWISDPTWMNHHPIWELAGCKRKTYPYFEATTRSLDFRGMMAALETAESGDVVLLHSVGNFWSKSRPQSRPSRPTV